MASPKIIGAVEIGTSKTSVLVAEVVDQFHLNIIGRSVVPTAGVKKGRIINLKKTNASVHHAINEADRNASVDLKSVYLALSGSHIVGERRIGKAQVSNREKIVTEHDVYRAEEEAKRRELQPGRVYVQFMRNPYEVDGIRVDEPFSVKGNELQANYWAVHADEQLLKNQLQILNSFKVKVEEMFLSSLASGRVVTDENEKKMGAMVLDIGAGTTDYALYCDEYVLRTGIIDVGGDHITNDISHAFSISWEDAEGLKIREGKAILKEEDEDEQIWVRGDKTIGDREVSRRSLHRIIHARMEELFQLVKQDIGPVLLEYKVKPKVIITGGSSRLTAIETLANQVLKMPSRLGRNPDWVIPELQKPEMSAVIGLLQFGFSDVSQDLPEEPRQKTLFGRFSDLIK